MSEQYFNNLRVALCKHLLNEYYHHFQDFDIQDKCKHKLSNLCRCKVKRCAFVLVHTPHVGLALQMDKIVIDLH